MYKKQGFTLIELLVVVLIIGILSAVALPQYQIVVAKARLVEAMAWADAIYKAQQIYYMDNSVYTVNPEDLDVSFPNVVIKKSMIYWPDSAWCTVQGGSHTEVNSASVECRTRDGIGFRKYYSNTYEPVCIANSENALGNRVCKTLSKQEPFSWDGGISNYYYIR